MANARGPRWLLSALALVACAQGDGDLSQADGAPTPDDAQQADDVAPDAAVDPDVAIDPVDAAPDAPTEPDVPATPDVPPATPDVPVSPELDASMDAPATPDASAPRDVSLGDLPRLDVVPTDRPSADAGTDAGNDASADVPADGACPSGTSLCGGSCVNHRTTATTCETGPSLGAWCGDTSCATLCGSTRARVVATRTGTTSMWFRARVEECSLCPASVEHRINLAVPAGIDYDLFVYRPCGRQVGSSIANAGLPDSVTVREGESGGSSDSFDYVIEVRYVSGSSCMPWTLTVEARANSASSC